MNYYTRLQENGYLRLTGRVPDDRISAALRIINLDLFRDGLSRREIIWWRDVANWFPHLRTHPDITKLTTYIPDNLRQGTACEPQILLGLPDEEEGEIHFHKDEPPPWANGRPYRTIVGVALTRQTKKNGGVIFQPFNTDEPFAAELLAGDIFVMHPDLEHAGGYNMSGDVRYVVYFRFLDDVEETE